MGRSVCVITPGSLASNPRLLKEAQALHEAGYGVTAVVSDYSDSFRGYDNEIERQVPWPVVRVSRPAGERYARMAAKAFARTSDKVGVAPSPHVAAAALGGLPDGLRRATLRVRADLYIAHYIAALPAAAAAAHRHGAMLGFDAEDFHSGEGGDTPDDAFRMRMVRRVEEAILPGCSHLTAASPLIGKAYAARYGVAPVTLLNVFPLAMAPAAPSPRPTTPNSLRAYWFSQTVGLDRGLQPFIQAMARARTRVTLDIRGNDRWGHGSKLMELARDLGIADRVKLLPMAPPEEMVRLATSYDLGLSLETDTSENRRVCLTNKIFTYLLAGVPVMMSDTPAQSALAADLADAACVVSLLDADGMARALDRLGGSCEALAAARDTAWRKGQKRYNWDVEKQALLSAVAETFARGGQGGH
jgi:glycosyltransferase involved in cell wall biosynthesis